MSDDQVLTGGCFCKAVRYQVTGKPILSAYCHCSLCQRFTAAAFIHTIHFPVSAFKWTHSDTPEDAMQGYSVPIKPWKTRWRCKTCGVTVASHNSDSNKWSVWGTQLDRDENLKIKNWDLVAPTAHIFYETRLVDVKDDLGKWAGYEGTSYRMD